VLATSPTPHATVRKIADVPSAHRVAGRGCTDGEVYLDSFLNGQLYRYSSPGLQRIVAHNAAPMAAHELPQIAAARRDWIRAGYPAGYPVVRDLAAERDAVAALVPLLKHGELRAITPVAERLDTAQKQYDIDVESAHRSGCVGI